MTTRRRPRFGPGEIIVLIAIGVGILIFITGNHRLILDKLYSPYAFFIVVIMLVEYLLLKGADRSEIYRRELEAALQRRRDDLLTMREIERRLVDLRGQLNALNEGRADPDAMRSALDLSRGVCGEILENVRENI